MEVPATRGRSLPGILPTTAEDTMATAEDGREGHGARAPSGARGRQRPHHGFTLVELLAVIAVIGVLVGLLLPAVQSARESGRRAQCSNNQRQLALGMLSANDANGTLPGWRNRNPNPAFSGTTPSWPIVIMPFIERLDIHRRWSTAAPTSGSNSPAIAVFICPSTLLSAAESGTTPRLSYAGNCGSCNNLPDGVMVDTTGNARVPLSDVSRKDGTTFTLVVAEKCGRGMTQGWWDMTPTGCTFGNGVASNNANAVSAVGITGSPASPVVNSTTAGAPGLFSQPSSNHPMGAVVAYCDGHVGYLTNNLASNVYAQLLSWDHEGVKTASPYASWHGNYLFQEKDLR